MGTVIHALLSFLRSVPSERLTLYLNRTFPDMAQKINESNFWKWLSTGRQAFMGDLHMHRVENGIDTGTPDVEGHLLDFNSFWVELKAVERPARPTTPIHHNLKPAQIGWIHKRTQAGGRAYLLIQVGAGDKAKVYLIGGQNILQFQQPVFESDLHIMSGGEVNLTPQAIICKMAGAVE